MLKSTGTYLLLALALLTSVAGVSVQFNAGAETAVRLPADKDILPTTLTSFSAGSETVIHASSPTLPDHFPEIFESEEEEEEIARHDLERHFPTLVSNFTCNFLALFFDGPPTSVNYPEMIDLVGNTGRLVLYQHFRI